MIIAASQLTVTRLGNGEPTLRNLSFEVAEGERVLLIGPSASGKSTLLQVLAGALENLGTVEVSGQLKVASAGLLLQNPADSTLAESVYRDVAFGAENSAVPTGEIAGLVNRSLGIVGLAELVAQSTWRQPSSLSGGELQRACLAGLLTLAPKLLLLDEPTSHLDAAAAAAVRTAVLDYVEVSGAAVVLAEHRFELWLPMFDRVLVIDAAGNLFADGPWEDVLRGHAPKLAELGIWLPGAQPATIATQTASGQITALIGPSGSGKTTHLMSQIQARLTAQKSGVGSDAGSFGWLPQNPAMAMSGSNLMECVLGQKIEGADSAKVEAAKLALLELGIPRHTWNHWPQAISGGQQRLVALAAALQGEPSVVYLDEPTVGLDTHAWRRVVRKLLNAQTAGAQLVIATHDADLLTLANEVVEFEPEAQKPVAPKTEWPISPVAGIGVSIILLIGSMFFKSLAGVTYALVAELALLVAALAIFPRLGEGASVLAKLLVPVSIGSLSVGFGNWWLSANHATTPAVILGLRTAFFGLPSIFLAVEVSTSRLGDQLGQFLRLPARPVVAAMVGLYRARGIRTDWQTLALVRRVRGVAGGGLAEISRLTVLSLLEATRSAQVLAVAMESRGFGKLADSAGTNTKRTWAQPATWGKYDPWALLLAGGLVALGLLAH